jgi:hypothetical protein
MLLTRDRLACALHACPESLRCLFRATESPIFLDTLILDVLLAAGVRAVQSMPRRLCDRGGDMVGRLLVFLRAPAPA